MQMGHVTTPFGRRPVTYAMLKDQLVVGEIDDGASADKWRLYRALCEARTRFGITDRALAVMNALLSFYPKNELCAEDGLIVFPSNAQLSLRSHGMAEQTIRRHISALIDAGLLSRRDSANGKRFVRRSRAGEIDEAFGFSLAPLLARAEEIERLAAEVNAERIHLSHLRERLTICRRDVAKLIATAIEEGAPGDWDDAEVEYRNILLALPRKPEADLLEKALEEMEFLRENILNQLQTQIKARNRSGSAYQNERHIQNSKPESSSAFEPRFDKTMGEIPNETVSTETGLNDGETQTCTESGAGQGSEMPDTVQTCSQDREVRRKRFEPGLELKPFPLGMVLAACPEITNYGPCGLISSWRDLMAAAVIVRSMLGVSPSAYEEACAALGPENAATVIACILERASLINSAGGYLRDLTRRAERSEFSIGPMLMAQIRANGGSLKRAG